MEGKYCCLDGGGSLARAYGLRRAELAWRQTGSFHVGWPGLFASVGWKEGGLPGFPHGAAPGRLNASLERFALQETHRSQQILKVRLCSAKWGEAPAPGEMLPENRVFQIFPPSVALSLRVSSMRLCVRSPIWLLVLFSNIICCNIYIFRNIIYCNICISVKILVRYRFIFMICFI